ncbi:hypothetical protein E2C01_072160 [Portunus trituberculatus]|uniref:Uncharacterized protein n=1 Tax=Portunus trituberculatus TaxID=210409 RepID=A0A5B7I9Z5_PORTR|nr:hypothetical protein [Portunus trituberculatus]
MTSKHTNRQTDGQEQYKVVQIQKQIEKEEEIARKFLPIQIHDVTTTTTATATTTTTTTLHSLPRREPNQQDSASVLISRSHLSTPLTFALDSS